MLTEREAATAISTPVDAEAAGCRDGQGLPASPGLVGSTPSRSWDGRLALVVSNVGSPPVLACLVVALTALKLATPGAWMWGGVYALLGVLLPFLYVVWLVKRGDVTDINIRLRKQRAQPFLVTILCNGLAWLVLTFGSAPPTMTIVAGATLLQVMAVFAVTLRWKISMHVATAAGATTMVWALFGTPLPFVFTVPLVAWSRVRLRRHSLSQTVAGALLGFFVFLAAAALLPSG